MSVPEEWEERLLGLEMRVERLTKEKDGLKETIRNMEIQEKAYRSCIDELKEKAEKYDELLKRFKIYTGELCWQQDRFIEVFNKLEAVKKVVKKWDGDYPSPLAMGDIRKILEALG